jgi:hypothetical protein
MKIVKTALLAGMILCSVSAVRAQVSIGISIGAPPPPPAVVYVQPPQPEPDFAWVEGYWYPVGHHYKWHEGYWTRPPYVGAYWVPPHHDGERYFAGYWTGKHGRVEHDHHWDHDRDRDFHEHADHEHDHGHGHGHGNDQGEDH